MEEQWTHSNSTYVRKWGVITVTVLAVAELTSGCLSVNM